MKVLFSFLLSLLLASSIAAQTRKDSLETRLADTVELERLEVLAELEEALFSDNPSQAIEYGREAISLLASFPNASAARQVLYWKGRAHARVGQMDSVLVYGEKLREWAVSNGDLKGEADAAYLEGLGNWRQSSFEIALEFLEDALSIYESLNDQAGISLALNDMGSVFVRQGIYDEALVAYDRALMLREDSGDKVGIAETSNNIGNVHNSMGDLEEALRFYFRTLALDEERGDERGISYSFINIGGIYVQQNEFETALSYFERSLLILEKLDDKVGSVVALTNIGVILIEMGRFEEALTSLERALALGEEMDDVFRQHRTLTAIGSLYRTINRPSEALIYMKRALALSVSIGSLNVEKNTQQELSKIYEQLGRFEEALQAHRSYKAAYDSLFTAENRLVVSELREQYHTREQQQQITLLEQEQQIQERKAMLLYLGLGFLALALMAGFYYMRTLRLKNRIIEERTVELSKLSRAVEQSPASVVITDLKGSIEYVNPKFEELTGYQFSEISGQNPSVLKSDDTPTEVYEDLWNTISSGELWQGEFQNVKKNGETYWELASIAPVKNESGDIVSYVAVKEDITQSKDAARLLGEAKEEAESANRAKSTFLANMSHEIRTPMNAILGFTELLDERLTDVQDRQYLLYVQSSGRSLLTLINDILDLSKVEAGKLSIQPEAVDAKQLFEEMEHVFSHKIETKGIGFVTEIEPSLPSALVLDDVRLRQILINLLGNAVKFTEKGHVKLKVSGRYPDGEGSTLDLTIEVEDTGIGIPPDQVNKVFEAFEQTAGQSTAKYGGTGLGLAITKKLIELMNGEVSIESEVDKGSIFRVVLHDVAVASVDLSTASGNDGFDASSISFSPATIALADDIAVNRVLIKGLLSAYDLEIIEASNGEELVQRASESLPDLVLTDMKMPVMDGYAATELLKGGAATSEIPVIALTASVMEQSVETIKDLCDGYLAKPVTKKGLVQELMRHLEHSLMEQDKVEPYSGDDTDGMTSESLERLPEVIDWMERHSEKCEELKESQTINEIEEFGASIKLAGLEFLCPPLRSWGADLEMQAQLFDIAAMNKRLESYASLLEDLRNLIQA